MIDHWDFDLIKRAIPIAEEMSGRPESEIRAVLFIDDAVFVARPARNANAIHFFYADGAGYTVLESQLNEGSDD